jgi:alanine racemase
MFASSLIIDLNAIAANVRFLQQKVGGSCAVAGVVKADAYGLGMAQIIPVMEREGCRFFFTATLEEAVALRKITAQPIAVLSGIAEGEAAEFTAHHLIPVLNTFEDVAHWRGEGRKPAILHVETGMNRLALPPEDVQKLIDDPHGLDIQMVMSHLACADEPDHPLNREQIERFNIIAKNFPKAQKSLANSSGIFLSPDIHYDMVRPGMALYGLNPTPWQENPMRPVVKLDVPVVQVKTLKAGESVGYGASYRCAENTIVATVALGYADGFLRSLGNKGTLYFNGKPCPVIGRVSMDLVTVDVGALPVHVGDKLEVIGDYQSVDDLATAAGTLGYEILTSLGARYKRVYKG